MKLKLVDIEVEHEEEFQYGTCELCMTVGSADFPTYIFEDEEGDRYEVDGYFTNYGDLDTIEVDNIVDFAAFISEQDFDEIPDFFELGHLVHKYYNR